MDTSEPYELFTLSPRHSLIGGLQNYGYYTQKEDSPSREYRFCLQGSDVQALGRERFIGTRDYRCFGSGFQLFRLGPLRRRQHLFSRPLREPDVGPALRPLSPNGGPIAPIPKVRYTALAATIRLAGCAHECQARTRGQLRTRGQMRTRGVFRARRLRGDLSRGRRGHEYHMPGGRANAQQNRYSFLF